jgi:hypothetical protein
VEVNLPLVRVIVVAKAAHNSIMKISNDINSKLKILLLSLAVFSVASGLVWVFFGEKFPAICILINILSLAGAILFFKSKIRCITSDVRLSKNSILYIKNKNQFEIRKDEILKIDDSGFNSAPHEIIIFLHNGKTVEFFPSEKYGNFYHGKLKKILRSWLNSQ